MKLDSHGQNRKSFPHQRGAGRNDQVHWGGGWNHQQCHVSGATRQTAPATPVLMFGVTHAVQTPPLVC